MAHGLAPTRILHGNRQRGLADSGRETVPDRPAIAPRSDARPEEGAADRRLVAYVVRAPGREGDVPGAELVATLRGFLGRQLPEYMVPSGFVFLDRLPLTSSGKLARDALPAPGDEAVLTRAYQAPEGVIEETLASVWAEIFGLDRVGRNDHFFDLPRGPRSIFGRYRHADERNG